MKDLNDSDILICHCSYSKLNRCHCAFHCDEVVEQRIVSKHFLSGFNGLQISISVSKICTGKSINDSCLLYRSSLASSLNTKKLLKRSEPHVNSLPISHLVIMRLCTTAVKSRYTEVIFNHIRLAFESLSAEQN